MIKSYFSGAICAAFSAMMFSCVQPAQEQELVQDETPEPVQESLFVEKTQEQIEQNRVTLVFYAEEGHFYNGRQVFQLEGVVGQAVNKLDIEIPQADGLVFGGWIRMMLSEDEDNEIQVPKTFPATDRYFYAAYKKKK